MRPESPNRMGPHGPLLSKSEWSLGIVSDMVRAKDTRLPTNKQIKLVALGEFWKEGGAHSVDSHDSFMNFTK
jgi:hypothetical protein